MSFGGAAVNNSGTLTFNNSAVTIGSVNGVAGTGNMIGTNRITGGVGSNVTAITQASNSNALTISTNALTVNGTATTLTASGTAQFTVSSSVTGTGNLILNTNNNTRGILLSGTAVDHTGAITNSGTGTAFTTISANIGSSVTGVTNSGTSGLILSGTNTYTGGTSVTAGTVYFLNTNAKPTSGTHAFSAGTTLGLGVAASGSFFTLTDIDNAFSGTMTGNLSNVTVTATTNVGIDTTQGSLTYNVTGSPTKGLEKFGANTLTLNAANTYTGTTTISGGTLQLGDGGTTGSLATLSTITNNGNFTVNRNNAVAQGTDFSSSAISGTGSFTQAGSGTTTLNSATYTGGTTVSAGRLILVNTLTGGSSSNFVTNSELEFNITTGTNVRINGGTISGTGNFIKTGATTLNFGGGGGSAQTISLTGENSIIDVQVGILKNDFGNSAWTTNKAGLNVGGSGTFDTWDGNTTVDELTGSGTIRRNAAGSNAAGTNSITFGVNNGSGTFSGTVSNTTGTLNLIKNGTGTQTFSGTVNPVAASGATNPLSSITVNAGTLQFAKMVSLFNNTEASWTAAKINVKSAATLALNVDSAGTNGFPDAKLNTLLTNISVANSAAAGLQSGAVLGFDTSTATGGTFTQGNAIADSTGSGSFHGAIGVTKLGIGTLVLDKSNTYTGATQVNAGTMEISGAAGALTATSGVSINGGTLLLSGSAPDRIVNAAPIALGGGASATPESKLALGSGAVTESFGALSLTAGTSIRAIDFGAPGADGKLTFASLTGAAAATLSVWNWSGNLAGGGADQLSFTTGAASGGMLLSNVNFYSDGGTTLFNGSTGATFIGNELVPVPEPGALLSTLALFVGCLFRRRRQA